MVLRGSSAGAKSASTQPFITWNMLMACASGWWARLSQRSRRGLCLTPAATLDSPVERAEATQRCHDDQPLDQQLYADGVGKNRRIEHKASDCVRDQRGSRVKDREALREDEGAGHDDGVVENEV